MGLFGKVFGFVGDAVSKVAPFAGFIPGVGPLAATAIGIGANALGTLNDGSGGGGGGGLFSPTGAAGGFAASQGSGFAPAFPSSDPTETDTADQAELERIAGLFESFGGNLEGQGNELFEFLRQELSRSSDPNFGQFDFDALAEGGGRIGQSVYDQLFAAGGASEQGRTAAIRSNLQSGFNIGGRASEDFLTNNQLLENTAFEKGVQASVGLAPAYASVINTNTQASTDRLRSLLGANTSNAGAINTAYENLYGVTRGAQELPGQRYDDRLGRYGEEQNLRFQDEAFPLLLDKLQPESFLDRAGNQFIDSALEAGGNFLGDGGFGKIKDFVTGVFGGGGGGGNPIDNTFGQFGNDGDTFFGGPNFGATTANDPFVSSSGFRIGR